MNRLLHLFAEGGAPAQIILCAAQLALAVALASLFTQRKPPLASRLGSLALFASAATLLAGIGGRAWGLMKAGRALTDVSPDMREMLRFESHREAGGCVTLALLLAAPSLLLGLVSVALAWRKSEGRSALAPLAAAAAGIALAAAILVHLLPIPGRDPRLERARHAELLEPR